jgi:hypothetical protein
LASELPGYTGGFSKIAEGDGSSRKRAARNAAATTAPPPTAKTHGRRGVARCSSHHEAASVTGVATPHSLLATAPRQQAVQASGRQRSPASRIPPAITRAPSVNVATSRSSRKVGSQTASVTTGCTAKKSAPMTAAAEPPAPAPADCASTSRITSQRSTTLPQCRRTLVRW